MTTTEFLRLRSVASLVLATAVVGQRIALADLPQAGDLVFGLSNSNAALTIELVRGTATMGGGTKLTSPWQSTAFIEVVKFDNLGGIASQRAGQSAGCGFRNRGRRRADLQLPYAWLGSGRGIDTDRRHRIYEPDVGLQIGGGSITQTRLGEVAVSPDNTKILASGYDSGTALVYDYTAGDGAGGGSPAASSGRESATSIIEELCSHVGSLRG